MKKVIAGISAVAMTASMAAAMPAVTFADNPLAQTVYTADPSPVVFGDTLYLYTSHDKDNSDYFYMPDWQCYSTTDMQNWTHHGSVMADSDFTWAEKDTAWACQCIERNGKYYLYCPLSVAAGGGRGIGVGVSDSPTGPFKDAIGKPLVGPNWDYIDPTVYIDDDGQAYLYFGNPQLYYVKLNEDMISYSGDIMKADMGGFGKSTDPDSRTGALYTEGPWFYKRGSLYYMLYAAEGVPENISYSTSTSPTGPWTYRGVIMPKGEQGAAFTNHCGVTDYKNHSYFFYHNQRLPGGGGFDRSVAVEEFTYNADGTFPTIKMSDNGPEQIEALNPFKRVEGETMSWSSGVETEVCSAGGMDLANIENGDYIKVSGVDFGNGADTFTASVASNTDGGKIELHLGSTDGKLIGTLNVPGTGGWQEWTEVSASVDVSGKQDLYLKFTGGSGFLFNLDWWKFGSGEVAGTETPGTSTEPASLLHSTYESGTNSWDGRGAAKVSTSSDKYFSGGKSLYVSGREAAWNGAAVALNSKTFVPGETYSFSANVMFDSGKTEYDTFKLQLQYNDANGDAHYENIAAGTTFKGDWLKLENTAFTIPKGASDIYLYVETEAGSNSFYLDDVCAGTKDMQFEGAVKRGRYTPGDLNFDGVIDAFDVALAKRGIASGKFANAYNQLAADTDRSTEVTVSDLVLVNKFVLKQITEFPDNTPIPPEPETVPFDYDANLPYKAAPGNYTNPSSQGGRVVKETYNGINGTNSLNVYLPYGYDESKQYNIFYLMHGGGENENTIFSNDVKLNYILDNMIQNGELEPMIVVTPTFNKCAAETVWKEMKESIVPFVEGKYSTYATGTSAAELEASRMHRAYGGFSMGGGSTWNVLINDIDYFAYYMPLSGHCWGGANAVTDAVKNSKYRNSTYILAATGTDDIAYGNLTPLMNELKTRTDVFTYTSDFSKGNLYYLVAQGNGHWWGVVRNYVYDGLPYFFHEG